MYWSIHKINNDEQTDVKFQNFWPHVFEKFRHLVWQTEKYFELFLRKRCFLHIVREYEQTIWIFYSKWTSTTENLYQPDKTFGNDTSWIGKRKKNSKKRKRTR